MMEDRSGREGGLEEFEGSLLLFTKDNMFVGEAGERNNNVGKIINEATIKISKTKKRLHILNLPRVGPVLDDLNLVGSHKQFFRSENVTEILHPIFMKFAFLGFRIQTVLPQASEDFLDLLAVSSSVGRVNEDVVQIDNNTNV